MPLSQPDDPRPPTWVGHVTIHAADIPATKQFFLELGMRDVEPTAPVGILELRGGTHLLVLPAEEPVATGTPAPFDLMVDDVDAAHRHCAEAGLAPSEINTRMYHRSFTVASPSGHAVTVNSTHVSGEPV